MYLFGFTVMVMMSVQASENSNPRIHPSIFCHISRFSLSLTLATSQFIQGETEI